MQESAFSIQSQESTPPYIHTQKKEKTWKIYYFVNLYLYSTHELHYFMILSGIVVQLYFLKLLIF